MEGKLNSRQVDLLIEMCKFTEKEAQQVFDRVKAGDLFEKEKASLDPRRNLLGLWVEPPRCKVCNCVEFECLNPGLAGITKDYKCKNCGTLHSISKRFFCKICKKEIGEGDEICHP